MKTRTPANAPANVIHLHARKRHQRAELLNELDHQLMYHRAQVVRLRKAKQLLVAGNRANCPATKRAAMQAINAVWQDWQRTRARTFQIITELRQVRMYARKLAG